MGFFDTLGKKATEAYNVTTKKTGELAKEAKLRMKINENKSNINDLYKEIGKKVYEKHVREENIDIKAVAITYKDTDAPICLVVTESSRSLKNSSEKRSKKAGNKNERLPKKPLTIVLRKRPSQPVHEEGARSAKANSSPKARKIIPNKSRCCRFVILDSVLFSSVDTLHSFVISSVISLSSRGTSGQTPLSRRHTNISA